MAYSSRGQEKTKRFSILSSSVIARPSPNPSILLGALRLSKGRGGLGQACRSWPLANHPWPERPTGNLSVKTEKPGIPTSLTKPIGLAPRNDGKPRQTQVLKASRHPAGCFFISMKKDRSTRAISIRCLCARTRPVPRWGRSFGPHPHPGPIYGPIRPRREDGSREEGKDP